MAVTVFVTCEEKQQVQDKTQQINDETRVGLTRMWEENEVINLA